MEASFAQHYHLSLDDMLSMSWRRFRVLFGGVFSFKDDDETSEEYELGQGQIASSVDWASARPVETDLMTEFRGTQLHVGRKTNG